MDDVDDGVDAAVGEDGQHGEVVEGAREIYPHQPEVKQKEVHLVPTPAGDKTERDDHQRLEYVLPSA